MKSLAGQFLVASPHLRDPNFARTVVLMLQHEEQGALGVVVNRPGDKTVDEVWEMIGSPPVGCDQFVHVGGPVPGPLIAIHDRRLLAEKEVAKLYMSMQKDSIDELVRDSDAKFRLFSGHAGWGDGQLENEMRMGGWLTSPIESADDVFADPESMWKEVCGKIGRRIVAPDIPPQRLPKDPGLN